MKYSRFVCLFALTLAMVATARASGQTSALQKGVSVQLVNTTNAVAFPEADEADAWVVTVTADGQLYFGVKPVTAERLLEEMKMTPRRRDARLYIKADARAPFAALAQALHAAHENLFESAALLTQQPQNPLPRDFVPPYGLEVNLSLPSSKPILVQLLDSGSATPKLKVNDQEIVWSELQHALAQSSRGQSSKLVVIEADKNLPTAPVIRVMDVSRSVGAATAISLMDF